MSPVRYHCDVTIDFGHHTTGPPQDPNLVADVCLDPWRIDMVIPVDDDNCDIVMGGQFYRVTMGAEDMKQHVHAACSIFNGINP